MLGPPKDGIGPLPKGVVFGCSELLTASCGTEPKVSGFPNVGAIAGATGGATAASPVGTPKRLAEDLFSFGLKNDLVLAAAGVEVAPAGTVNVISAGAGADCLLMSTFSNFPEVSVVGLGGQQMFGTFGMRFSTLKDTNIP